MRLFRSLCAGLSAALALAATAMAGPISNYPAATLPLTGTETLVGSQNGRTVNITAANIATSGLGFTPTSVTGLTGIQSPSAFKFGLGLSTVATSGAFSDLITTPTTLAGYGITDALKASNNLSDLPTPATALSNLGGLSSTSAAATYLSQASAASTYLTQATAASTYATAVSDAAKLPLTGGTLTGASGINLNATAAPTAVAGTTLHLTQADAASNVFLLDSFGGGTNFSPRRADGTNASPTAVQANEVFGTFNAYGYNGSAYTSAPVAQIRQFACDNFTTGDTAASESFYSTLSGATSQAERMRIDCANGALDIGTTSNGGFTGANVAGSVGISDATAFGTTLSGGFQIGHATGYVALCDVIAEHFYGTGACPTYAGHYLSYQANDVGFESGLHSDTYTNSGLSSGYQSVNFDGAMVLDAAAGSGWNVATETILKACWGGGASFTASQTTTTLNVTAITSGSTCLIRVGQTIVSGGTTEKVTALGTGTGLTGTYTVSVSQTLSSQVMTAQGAGLIAPSFEIDHNNYTGNQFYAGGSVANSYGVWITGQGYNTSTVAIMLADADGDVKNPKKATGCSGGAPTDCYDYSWDFGLLVQGNWHSRTAGIAESTKATIGFSNVGTHSIAAFNDTSSSGVGFKAQGTKTGGADFFAAATATTGLLIGGAHSTGVDTTTDTTTNAFVAAAGQKHCFNGLTVCVYYDSGTSKWKFTNSSSAVIASLDMSGNMKLLGTLTQSTTP